MPQISSTQFDAVNINHISDIDPEDRVQNVDSKFDKGECLRYIIYYIGSIVALMSISIDVIYVRKSPFSNQTLFLALSIILVSRLVIIIIYASTVLIK